MLNSTIASLVCNCLFVAAAEASIASIEKHFPVARCLWAGSSQALQPAPVAQLTDQGRKIDYLVCKGQSRS